MTKILDGIKVIDFTKGYTGSYGTMILSDFGADIIKIEDPETEGDYIRTRFPKNEKGSAYHAYLNRGKKSICVDRRTSEGQKIIKELIDQADVVCDCFPAGELEACNLGYDQTCATNPGIIYASLTGFGKTGPMSFTSGSDLTAEATSGLMDTTGHTGAPPTAHGSRIAEQFGNLFLAGSIVAALIARMETGEGQVIDISASDCMYTALENVLLEQMYTGVEFKRKGNASTAIAPYDTFIVKDGFLSTAVSTDSQWDKFCEAMDMPELRDDPRFTSNADRMKHYHSVLRKLICSKFDNMTRAEIQDMLWPYQIPSGPGLTVDEAVNSEVLNFRHMIVEVEDPSLGKIKMPGIPIKMSGIEDEPTGPAPLLGADTMDCLKKLGYSDDEINELLSDGTIKCVRGAE